jgi:hypothetical protein
VTTPTTDPHIDLLSERQVTSGADSKGPSSRNQNINPIVAPLNRQEPTTPTEDDDDYFISEIDEEIPDVEGEICKF